jgi:hypothetical protein
VSHLPSLNEWRKQAWDRLCEARAVVSGLRDFSPAELEIWLKHVSQARAAGITEMRFVLPSLHKELLEKGFVKEGWWDTLLKDVGETASD